MENLKEIKETFEEIGGSWNGEDDRFVSDGDVYSEEDAHIANEIVEKVVELENLIKQFNEN